MRPGPVSTVSAVETSRLAAIPLFADLDDADLAAIAAAAVEVEAAEGETLATQGDLGHAMFAIERAPEAQEDCNAGHNTSTLEP